MFPDLLDIVAAVNGVIDFLPAVRKLCKEKTKKHRDNNNEGLVYSMNLQQHIDLAWKHLCGRISLQDHFTAGNDAGFSSITQHMFCLVSPIAVRMTQL